MKPRRLGNDLLLSLAVATAVWVVFTYPLIRHVNEGIPSSARTAGEHQVRELIPGDHLQLLYHFWLLQDVLAGNTPLFHDLYEFNTGDDSARYEPGSYYLPGSLVYAAVATVAGRAAGYNAASWFTVWLTYLFVFLLVRRYTEGRLVPALAALLAITLPYPWIAMLGGSPTGFAQPWIPLLLLGLDRAVREGRVAGGLLAGLALVMAASSDTHVFFFAVLATPAWILFAAVAARGDPATRPSGWIRRWAIPLLPLLLLGALAYALVRLGTSHIATSASSQGRSWMEVALFSPQPRGLLGRENLGHDNQVYLGFLLPAFLFLGFLFMLLPSRGASGSRPRPLLVLLLLLGMAAIVSLALGPYGPMDGRLLALARKLVPPYAMIRQAGKIYCLLPSLLALASGLCLAEVIRRLQGRVWWARVGCGVVVLLLVTDFAGMIRPTLCLLPDANAAYQAVADDESQPPRALVVPLWPGDSHYTSAYLDLASLYHLRLVNGYSAFTPASYETEVFQRFQSVNLGMLSDEQVDALQAHGVTHLIIHEDLFPEKVSPFPVGQTLQRLLHHPRLQFLTQDGPVWSFRLLAQPRGARADETNPFYFPARRYEMERQPAVQATRSVDSRCSGGGFLRLHGGDSTVQTPPTFSPPAPKLRYLARLRGTGRMSGRLVSTAGAGEPTEVRPGGEKWVWRSFPVPSSGRAGPFSLELRVLSGEVDVDLVLLTAGKSLQLKPGETVTLPANAFFHAGHSTPKDRGVSFEPLRDADRVVFYGPHLPLDPGTYRLTMICGEPVAREVVGHLDVVDGAGTRLGQVDIADEHPTLTFVQPDNLPVDFPFRYNRRAPCVIERIDLMRVE